jgi:4-amino-4-deoxy-L-arabinose transferase-like glycosyltransferase
MFTNDYRDSSRIAFMRSTFVSVFNWVRGKETPLVLILAFFVGIAGALYSLYLGGTLDFADEREYISIASNLALRGVFSLDGIHPTAYRPPGYPFLLAAFIKLGAGVMLLRLVNFAFLIGTIVLIYILAIRICSKEAGMISAVLVLCYPVLFYTAGTLYPQTLAGLLFILAVIPFASSRVELKRCTLSGLTFGLLVLTVPTFVFALSVSAAWLVFSTIKTGLRNAVVLLSSAAIMILPWTVRNYAQFGDFVFVSLNSGTNLLLGNSEFTTANSGVKANIRQYSNNFNLNEIELDKHYRIEALKFIKENKIHSLKLYLLKVANYFNYDISTATAARTIAAQDMIMLVSYGFLLFIAFIRLSYARTYKFSQFEALLVLLYVLNALFSAVFFTRIRFRLPFDLLLIIVDSVFIFNVVNTRWWQPLKHTNER